MSEPEVRKIRIRHEPEEVPRASDASGPSAPDPVNAGRNGGHTGARRLEPDDGAGANLIDAAPGLARIAASAAWRTTTWTAGLYARAGARILESAAAGESAGELFERAEEEVRGYVSGLVGVLGPDPDHARPASAFGNTARNSSPP